MKKSQDYQHPLSTVKQADHYPHGINTITDMVHQKMVRVKSLLEAAELGADSPNFEGVEDSLKDAINYLSFGVSWLRQKMEGQNTSRDIFNRPLLGPAVDPDKVPAPSSAARPIPVAPYWSGGAPGWTPIPSTTLEIKSGSSLFETSSRDTEKVSSR